MTETEIADAAIELAADYQSFASNYKGPDPVDAHAVFLEMLRQWQVPWPPKITGLGGLTVEQLLLAWGWQENDAAKYLLDGEAVATGWKYEDAMACGVISAVSAAKSLFHAQSLLASGSNAVVHKALPPAEAGLRHKVAGRDRSRP